MMKLTLHSLPSSIAIPRCTSCGCLEWTRAHDKRIMLSVLSSSESPLPASATSLSQPCQQNNTKLYTEDHHNILINRLHINNINDHFDSSIHTRTYKWTYDDDVRVAPGNLVAAAEEGANGVEEVADFCLHVFKACVSSWTERVLMWMLKGFFFIYMGVNRGWRE